MDPAGPDGVFATLDDGLQLTPGSPVLDQGDNTISPETDLIGNTRIFDGDTDGQAVTDLGAYELIPEVIFADGFETPNAFRVLSRLALP